MKINWKYTWNCIIHILAGITLGFIMFACKSSKSSCDAYGSAQRVDTVYLEQIHTHVETDSVTKCIYFPYDTVYITYDTYKNTQNK